MEHKEGLAHDLPLLLTRRRALQIFGMVPLIGCGVAATSNTTGGSCSAIPTETGGPYPGDGSNGPNVLAQSGVVRSDMRSSFGSSATTAAGVLLTVELELVAADCSPLEGRGIYLWHCDKDGKYSMYDLPSENYLRAVQATNADGKATFTTIFPGCYSGRVSHMHFEIFDSVGGAKLKTSQLTFPAEPCNAVYDTTGYATSKINMAKNSLATDMVFADGYSTQLASVGGTAVDGMTAKLKLGL